MTNSYPTLSLLLSLSVLCLTTGCPHHPDHEEMDLGPRVVLNQRGAALYVALGKAGSVAVVDLDSFRVTGKIPLSTKYLPHHLSISPDHKRVGVAAPSTDFSMGHGGHGDGGSRIYILDSVTGATLAQADPGGLAHNLVFLGTSGASVAYAVLENGAVHVADGQSLQSKLKIPTGKDPLEVTLLPGGRELLVANNRSASMTAVDSEGKLASLSITVPQGPVGAWMGKAGEDPKAYVTCEEDKKLVMIDGKTKKLEAPVAILPGTPGQAATTADGKTLVVAIEDQEKLLLLNPMDLSAIAEIDLGQRPHGLVAAPTGNVVYVTDESEGRVYEVDISTKKVLRQVEVGGAPNGIAYRPAV